MQLPATQIKVGMLVKIENELYSVIHLEHRTPGNWRAMVHAKFRNVRTGGKMETRLRAEEKVEKADMETHEMEFLYADADMCHFMNTENFEQIAIHRDAVGDAIDYMTPNIKLKVSIFEGSPVGIELPDKVVLEVVETEPALKGATISNVTKPAKLETGAVVQVPPFIAVGERVRVDTRDGSYVERA